MGALSIPQRHNLSAHTPTTSSIIKSLLGNIPDRNEKYLYSLSYAEYHSAFVLRPSIRQIEVILHPDVSKQIRKD